MSRELVEDYLRVELRFLAPHAKKTGSCVGTVEWGESGVRVRCSLPAAGGDEGEGTAGRLVLRWWYQGERAYVRAVLVSTAQPFGGRRWWVVCPGCSRRCGALFVAGLGAACRVCLGLAYQSQRDTPFGRACEAARKVRLRHGGPANLGAAWDKPPRMHWRTWARLRAREAVSSQAMVEGARALLEQVRRVSRAAKRRKSPLDGPGSRRRSDGRASARRRAVVGGRW